MKALFHALDVCLSSQAVVDVVAWALVIVPFMICALIILWITRR